VTPISQVMTFFDIEYLRNEGVACGEGCPLPTGGRVWGRGCAPSPEIFFQYCIIKWPVLVDSDVLHVLLIVVVKLETCT